MASNTVHLSLLSRGVGEVKKNGHEKVDVVLEPEDYFNYAQDSSRLYLPPIQPKYNSYLDTSRSQGSTQREVHELYMPKTFITRKGALLLFSEDYANKTRSTDYRPDEADDSSGDKLGLNTVEELSRSILSYGNRKESEVNLFVYDKKKTPRKFRPGYSAKRYLSRLTRSFDDTFLDKLLTSGYVSEKTLFYPNALMPHLRRRINDDLSSYPQPYRVMKHMLLAPGILSGYTFYTGIPDQSGDGARLEEIGEEDEDQADKAGKLEIIDTKDGVAKSVTYSDLSKEEKEQVLADLLVKSAINHALEKQKEILDQQSIGESAEIEHSDARLPSGPGGDQLGDEKWGLNMTEAVKSYIESQVTPSSQQEDYSDTTYLTPRSFRGGRVPAHSVKSFEVNPFGALPEIAKKGDQLKRETAPKRKPLPSEIAGVSKEYIGGIPVASLKDTQSVSSITSSHKSSSSFSKSSMQDSYAPIQAPPLSPIMDVNSEAYGLSREASLNPRQPVPPIMKANVHVIDPGLAVPGLSIQPPTPQVSNLTKSGHSGQPEQTTDQLSERLDDRSSVSDSQSHEFTTGTESDSEAVHRRRHRRKKPMARTTSVQSLGEGGMIPAGGLHLGSSSESVMQAESLRSYNSMKGGALKRSKAGSSITSSRKDLRDTDSTISGAVVFGPEGEVVKVGESLIPRHEETTDKEDDQEMVGPEIDAIEEANQELAAIEGKDEGEGGQTDDSRGGDTGRDKPSSRSQSVASKMSGYTKNIRDIDLHGGDVDPTHSIQTLGITGYDSRTVSRQDGPIKETPEIESEIPKLDSVLHETKEGTIAETVIKTGIHEDSVELDENGEVVTVLSRAGTKVSEKQQQGVDGAASRQLTKISIHQPDDEQGLEITEGSTLEKTELQEGEEYGITKEHSGVRSKVASRQATLEPELRSESKASRASRSIKTPIGQQEETRSIAAGSDDKQSSEKSRPAYVQGDTMSSIAMTTKEPTRIKKEGGDCNDTNISVNPLPPVCSDKTGSSSLALISSADSVCSTVVSSRSLVEQLSNNLAESLASKPLLLPSSNVDTVLTNFRKKGSTESLTERSRRSSQASRSSQAMSEQELVEALSEHAQKIAETVLSRPETGEDLARDAQAAANMWLEDHPPNTIGSSMSMRNLTGDALLEEMAVERERSQSAEPSVDEYKELLKETLATVVSKVSGDTEEDLKQAEVSPDLVEALANQEIAVEDIEITKDEDTGRTVIRAKSGASTISGKNRSRKSSRQSLVVDVPSGDVIGARLKDQKSERSKIQPTPPITPKPSKTKTNLSTDVSMVIPERDERVSRTDSQTPSKSRRSPTKSPKNSPSPGKVSKEHSKVSVIRTPLPDEIAEEETSVELVESSRENTMNENLPTEKSISKTSKEDSGATKRGKSKSPSKTPKTATPQPTSKSGTPQPAVSSSKAVTPQPTSSKSGTPQPTVSKSPTKLSGKKGTKEKSSISAENTTVEGSLGDKSLTPEKSKSSIKKNAPEKTPRTPTRASTMQLLEADPTLASIAEVSSNNDQSMLSSKEPTEDGPSREPTLTEPVEAAVASTEKQASVLTSKQATEVAASREATQAALSKQATQVTTGSAVSKVATPVAASKGTPPVASPLATSKEDTAIKPSKEASEMSVLKEGSGRVASEVALSKQVTNVTKQASQEFTSKEASKALSKEATAVPRSRETTVLPSSKEPTSAALSKEPTLTALKSKEGTDISSSRSVQNSDSKDDTRLSMKERSKISSQESKKSKIELSRDPTEISKVNTTLSRDPTLASLHEKSDLTRESTTISQGVRESKNQTRGPSIIPASKSNTQVSDGPERETTDTLQDSTISREKTGDISTEDESDSDDKSTGDEGKLMTDMSTKSHTMPKAKRSSITKKPSIDGESGKGDLSMDVINYGEADLPEAEKSEVVVRASQPERRRSSAAQSQKSGKGLTDIADDEDARFRQELENLVEGDKSGPKSAKSAKSQTKSVKSKTPEDKEEFVVGKVRDKKEMEKLYAPIEEPPKPVEKKPRVPASKPPAKAKKAKKGKKATKKEEKEETKAPEEPEVVKAASPEPEVKEEETPPEPEATPSPQPTLAKSKSKAKQKATSRKKAPSPEPEQEEDMEFIIVRDEFSDEEEDEPVRTKSVKSYRSFKSVESKDTDLSVATRDSDMSEETRLKQISNRDARAAKRAAAAAKKREDMERKRREREEKLKKDKEAAEQKEIMERELEEERRKREEDRRNQRARQDEEKRRQEEEELNQEARQRQEVEREKRLKEEYRRKMEEMQLKKIEDDLRRKELEEQRRKEEAERAAEEAEMLAKMAEEERLEYERKKAEEEELKRLKEEADRIKREEDAAKALEEARRLAEEMARKQLELERRMAFNRGLQLEATGLSRTQEVTRAFVWSYYELLKWLGLDVPEFEKWKATLRF